MSDPGRERELSAEEGVGRWVSGLLFVIPGELPDLNQYIRAERSNVMAAAALKKRTDMDIIAHIKRHGLPKVKSPVFLRYAWHCKNRRKDLDNICFAQKFVQDAMVRAGVIPNDGWNNIIGFSHDFFVDKDNPRIEVRIT